MGLCLPTNGDRHLSWPFPSALGCALPHSALLGLRRTAPRNECEKVGATHRS